MEGFYIQDKKVYKEASQAPLTTTKRAARTPHTARDASHFFTIHKKPARKLAGFTNYDRPGRIDRRSSGGACRCRCPR